MKIDIEAYAQSVGELAGLKASQFAGLALIFRTIEREAFCDGFSTGSGTYTQHSDVAKAYQSYGKPSKVSVVVPETPAAPGFEEEGEPSL